MVLDLIARKEQEANPVGLVALAGQIRRADPNRAYGLVQKALIRATPNDVEGIFDLCEKYSFPIECDQSFYELNPDIQERILAYGRAKPSLELLLPLDFWNRRIITALPKRSELEEAIASLESSDASPQVSYEVTDKNFDDKVKVTTLHLKQGAQQPFTLMIAFNNAVFTAYILCNEGKPIVRLPKEYTLDTEYSALNLLDDVADWYKSASQPRTR